MDFFKLKAKERCQELKKNLISSKDKENNWI